MQFYYYVTMELLYPIFKYNIHRKYTDIKWLISTEAQRGLISFFRDLGILILLKTTGSDIVSPKRRSLVAFLQNSYWNKCTY